MGTVPPRMTAISKTMTKSHQGDTKKVRSAIAVRQAELLAKGIPIYYMDKGVLTEELPGGEKRKAADEPPLPCSEKV